MRTSPAVTLYTRVWIEIVCFEDCFNGILVTLYTRVWIEMSYNLQFDQVHHRHPLHEGVD